MIGQCDSDDKSRWNKNGMRRGDCLAHAIRGRLGILKVLWIYVRYAMIQNSGQIIGLHHGAAAD